MSQNSENGLLAMLDRLYRTFIVAYWLFIFFFFPIFAVVRIVESIQRRRVAKKKEERVYWLIQMTQYLCLLYVAICLYYHIFQDFIGLFVDLETQARITWMFEFATGIPGFFWYYLTDRKIALAGNATDFAVATLIGVIGCILVLLLIDYLKLYGDLDMAGNWVLPAELPGAKMSNSTARKHHTERYPSNSSTIRKSTQEIIRRGTICLASSVRS